MDIKQLWLNVQDLWGALDQHPLLHSSIALLVLLVVALIVGRLAPSVVLLVRRALAGQQVCEQEREA